MRRPRLTRAVKVVLREFDREDRELVLRFRLWKQEWLPYRTAEFLGFDDDTLEMELGPWKWHQPRRLKKARIWAGKTWRYRRTWMGAIRRRNWPQAKIWLGLAGRPPEPTVKMFWRCPSCGKQYPRTFCSYRGDGPPYCVARDCKRKPPLVESEEIG